MKIPEIELKDIKTIYLGKKNKCYCGCSGNYAYTSMHREQAGKERGYEVRDDEVSDRKVQSRLKRMKRLVEAGAEVIITSEKILTVVDGEKELTVYLI